MDNEEMAHALWSIAYSKDIEKSKEFLEYHKNDFDETAIKKFSEIVWYLVETGDFTAAENLINTTYSIFEDQYIKGRILVFKGSLEFRRENYEKAADLFKKAHTYLEDADGAVAEMNYGLALHKLGKIEDAVEIFKKTYFIFKKENCPVAAASAIQNLGDIYQEQSRHKKALSCYKKAKKIHETEGNSVDTARVEMSMGISLQDLSQIKEALQLFDHALSVFEREQFFLDVARLHLNRSNLFIALKHLDEAEESCNLALEIFKKAELYPSVASALLDKAIIYRSRRRFSQALKLADRAVRISASCNQFADSARALREKAEIALEMGSYEEAEDFLTTCSVILVSKRERALTEIVRVNLLRAKGDYTKALALSEKLLHYFEDPSLERATVLMNHALLLFDLNEHGRTLFFLDEAKSLYESFGILLKACDVDMNRAVLFFEMEQFDESLRTYERIREIFRNMKMDLEVARVDYNIGNVLREKGDMKKALQKLLTAHRVFSTSQLGRDFYLSKANIGFALLHLKKMESSERYLRTSLEYARTSRDFHLEYESLYGLGLIEASRKNFGKAVDFYEKSVSAFYRARSSIESEPLRINYLKDKRGIYDRLIASCLESNRCNTLFQHMELFKSRTIYEKITGDWHGRVSVEEVRDHLSCDEVLLNYYVLPDRLIIGVLTRDDFQVRDLSFQEDLYRMLLEYRLRLFFRSKRLDILERFYHLLISPVEDFIQGKNLWYAPHDLLHYVPFASLFDGEKFLVQNNCVAAVPSASLLMGIGTWGHSLDTSLLVKGSDLSFAEQEIEGIQRFFRDKKILFGDNARLDRISRYLPRNVVHFACHGYMRQDSPLFSELNLSEPYVLRAKDVLAMDFSGSLVVLSACNTGVNKILAGDEPMGFLRSFLYAGAKSIVSSLYFVDDESTSDLFIKFYRNLREGMSPAESLRKAQIFFIEKGTHPYFWSPFIVVGGLR